MSHYDNHQPEDENSCFDTESPAYTSTFTGESDKHPSTCVVEAVAEAIKTDPMELEPLYEAIDTDSLDQLFESPNKFQSGCITFRYEGRTVAVDAAGWIAVSTE